MSLSMLRSSYWENLSTSSSELWINVLRIHEIFVFLLILVVLDPILPAIDFGAKMSIPTVQDMSYQDIGFNPLFSYPINLKGHLCWPNDLNTCLENPTSTDPCCTELYDKASVIEESVSDLGLILTVAFLGIGYLAARCCMWYVYISRLQQQGGRLSQQQDKPTIDKRFWLKILWDSLVALAICQILTFIVTEYVKAAVGAPRPNYYALKLFSSVHSSDRSELDDNAQLSFPSGHASTSLSGLGLVSLFCFIDCLKFRSSFPLTSFVLVFVSLTPLVVAIYIGVSRMTDMWHFGWDILMGWCIGGVIMTISYTAFSGLSKDLHRIANTLSPPYVGDDVESVYHLEQS